MRGKRFVTMVLVSSMLLMSACGGSPATESKTAAVETTAAKTTAAVAGDPSGPAEAAAEPNHEFEEYAICIDANGDEKYNVVLNNLDLDGTLKADMYKDVTLKIACWTGEYQSSMEEYAKIFSGLTGCKVEIVSISDDFDTKVQLGFQQGDTYDIVLCPVPNARSYAASGYLLDMSELLETAASENYDQEDFIPGLWSAYAEYREGIYCLPFKADVYTFFYRKDLFEDEQVKQQYVEWSGGKELKVPETNEELIETARFFTKSENPDSPVDYGYCGMFGVGKHGIWKSRLGAYGGYDVGDDYSLGFDNEAGVKALKDLNALKNYSSPDWKSMDWDLANTFYVNGNAAMMEQWPPLRDSIEADGSPLKGKVGYGVTPGQAPTLGGWGLMIAKDTKNQEAAFKFCELATSRDGELLRIPYYFTPCRTSSYENKIVKEYGGEFYQTILASQEATKGVMGDPGVPYVSGQLVEIEEDYFKRTLEGEITAEEAIKQMAAEMEELIKTID